MKITELLEQEQRKAPRNQAFGEALNQQSKLFREMQALGVFKKEPYGLPLAGEFTKIAALSD